MWGFWRRGTEVLILLLFFCWKTDVTIASNVMKRIRERPTPDGSDEKWIQVMPAVRDILLSIDEKLTSLDSVKLTRMDYSMNQLIRRIASVESKLGRLESKFDLRFEKVEDMVVSKHMKEDFSIDHLSRRVESITERISSKAAHLDAKLDIKFERVQGKLELLERDLHNSIGDLLERMVKNEDRCGALQNEVIKTRQKLDEKQIKIDETLSVIKEKLVSNINDNFVTVNGKMTSIQTSILNQISEKEQIMNDTHTLLASAKEQILTLLQDSNTKIENLSLVCIEGDRSRSKMGLPEYGEIVTQEQLENLTTLLDRTLMTHETKFKELDSDVEMYTRKVVNGIQQLWKTSDELKADLSDTLEQGNMTREIVRREFRRLHEHIEPLPKLEPKLLDISEDLNEKVSQLSSTVDNSFATLLVAQNTFIDSCQRIQQEETHVYDILQQIVYEMRNRSVSDIHKITTELHVQSTEITKSISEMLAAILLAENRTTHAVNNLLPQIKLKNQCVILKVDELDWNAMESICRQFPLDEQSIEGDIQTSSIFVSVPKKIENDNLENDAETQYYNDSEITENSEPLTNEYEVEY